MSSLPKEILRIIASRYPLGNKELYQYLYGKNGRLNKNSLSATLSRMKKNGLLRLDKQKWATTQEGEELLKSKNSEIRKFFPNHKPKINKLPKTTIVIFDIPEKKKRYREWLRSELIGLSFELIQKSVWLGPSLPKEFIKYLEETKILKFIRFFRASEQELI